MNKKAKRAATAAALVLAMGAGAAGTWAYLNKTSGTVTNIFIAQSSMIDPDGEFTLKEHTIKRLPDGSFVYGEELNATTDDQATTYEGVAPGTTLKKDPKVTVKGLTGDAYVFVMVDNSLVDFSTDEGQQGIEAVIANGWHQLSGKKNVFYRTVTAADAGIETTTEEDGTEKKNVKFQTYSILKNDEVTVTNFQLPESGDTAMGNIKFKVYLTQKDGFTSEADAWQKAFNGATSTAPGYQLDVAE